MKLGTPLSKLWCSLRTTFLQCRKLLKEIGIQSSAEIEPNFQTNLLDLTMQIPGVLVAGVPGAGGYDAVFAIIVDQPQVFAAVEELWIKHNVLCLLSQAEQKGVAIKEIQIGAGKSGKVSFPRSLISTTGGKLFSLTVAALTLATLANLYIRRK